MAAVKDAVIVGGGIGGLALATGLCRAGIAVRVIEKGNRSDRLGTGISLMGNALRALDMLGLADRCIAAGYGYDTVTTCDSSGRVVDRMQPPRTFRHDRPGAFGIMRPDLADTLEQAAREAGAEIDFDTIVADLVPEEQLVRMTLSTGETLSTDLLVGADGVYSEVRKALFGDRHRPTYCGQGGIRYTTARPESLTGVTFYRAEAGQVVGAIPLSQTHSYFFILESGERWARKDQAELARIWREQTAAFTAPELVRAAREVNAQSPISYRPFDVLMMPRPWHRGRVVLIGDAVHSMSPQLTSGGGMAIEDAAVLSEEIAATNDVAAALEAYGARREPRVRPILETSLAICELEKAPSAGSHQHGMALLRRGLELLAQPI